MLAIGLMSGTSMDGIDSALIDTKDNDIQELAYASLSYAREFKLLLKAAELAAKTSDGDLTKAHHTFPQAIKDYLKQLNLADDEINLNLKEMAVYLYGKDKPILLQDVIHHSTTLHVDAVKQLLKASRLDANQIDVIGYHGQTLFHQPDQGISIQVGDSKYLAEELGITVVSDFRRRDVEAGGQGAPFAPLYHLALACRDEFIPSVVVNCGGIANLTLIPSSDETDLIGFDTGPGNGLIDKLLRQRTRGNEYMDTDGKYGKYGKVHTNILEILYAKALVKEDKNYFNLAPPKSLDIGDMHIPLELDSLSLEDASRTLEAFTADSIVSSLDLLNVEIPKQWILAGGGWNNPVILSELKQRLTEKLGTDVHIYTANEIGWNNQALEAQIFAYLAVRCLEEKPISLPGTTRAPKPLTGGEIYIPSTIQASALL